MEHPVFNAISANVYPVRHVLRDSDPEWGKVYTDREDSQEYWRLARVSGFLPSADPHAPICVCYDGTLLLSSIPMFRDFTRARKEFNETLCKLLFGGIYYEAASLSEIGHATINSIGYTRLLGDDAGEIRSMVLAHRENRAGDRDKISYLAPQTILFSELFEAYRRGETIFNHIKGIAYEQLLFGLTQLRQKNWPEALINFWTFIERLIELNWNRMVQASKGSTAFSRSDFLQDHRTWTASSKLEFLFQLGYISAGLYGKLNELRKARNSFVHKGEEPTSVVSSSLTEATTEFISETILHSKGTSVKFEIKVPDEFRRTSIALVHKNQGLRIIPEFAYKRLPPLPGEVEWGEHEVETFPDIQFLPYTE